ncbi:MAG: DUF115 domain-containing protein [Pedobacter sp.]|nr:MAG: DUF115 domain-containing protein [Pedobacter sp.]
MLNILIKKIKLKLKYKTEYFSDLINNHWWFLTPIGIKNNKKLKALKGKYAGQRCFVLGNGPSLLKCDLTLLKDEATIVSNANYLMWDQVGFVPNFLTVEDRLVAEDRGPEINDIKNITKIFPKDLSKFLKLDEKTMYVNFLRIHNDGPRFTEDFVDKVFWGGTVTYMNLQLAYYLGFTEIYMIGFDHNYKVTEKIVDNVITSEADDVNHFHPDYFGKGYRWHDPRVDRMGNAYKVARKFFESHNVKIANATVGGKLEVFERVDYNSLFKN